MRRRRLTAMESQDIRVRLLKQVFKCGMTWSSASKRVVKADPEITGRLAIECVRYARRVQRNAKDRARRAARREAMA